MAQEITVFDNPRRDGTPLVLSESIGKGGEGEVYVGRPSDDKEIAVKVFSPAKIEKDGKFLSEKIAEMLEMGNASDKALIRHPNIAWPQMLVYDKGGSFVGYAMKRAKGTTLDKLAHPKLYQKYFNDLDRVKLARMLMKLLASADDMHRRYIRIGDVNPKNILCDENYNPCWIDVDSYQIGVGDESNGPPPPELMNLAQSWEDNKESNAKLKPSQIWRCPVGRPEMTPPEHLHRDYSTYDRTYTSDLFSLAILIFQCMMLGRHPYDSTDGGSPAENIRKGHFPYGGNARPGKSGSIPKGPWYNMWSHYTFKIKKLFARALREGAHDASKRPTMIEWISNLDEYEKLLVSPTAYGKHSKEMMPAKEKEAGLKYQGKQEKS